MGVLMILLLLAALTLSSPAAVEIDCTCGNGPIIIKAQTISVCSCSGPIGDDDGAFIDPSTLNF